MSSNAADLPSRVLLDLQHGKRTAGDDTPGYVGASRYTKASIESPSGPRVPGMNPQSKAYATPRTSGRERVKAHTRDPRGDSMTTRRCPAAVKRKENGEEITAAPAKKATDRNRRRDQPLFPPDAALTGRH